MTFVLPKPGGWAAEETLTSAQMNALQAAILAADTAMQEQVTATAVSLTAERRRSLTARHRLIGLDLNGITPSDNGASIGVCSHNLGRDVLLAKGTTNGVFSVQDADLVSMSGITVAAITSDLKKIIFNGSRHLAIGAGGNRNAISTTNGSTWTAGGVSSLAADPVEGVWDGTEFIIATAAGDSAHSTDGVAWTNAGGADDIGNVLDLQADGGLAVLSGGTVIGTGNKSPGTIAFVISTDHGASWADTGATVPDAANYTNHGHVAGNGGSEIYWLGNPAAVSTTRLDLCVSTNGVAWTLRSSITGLPTLGTSAPKLYMCQDTGMLVSIADSTGAGFVVNVSTDLGFTWSGNLLYPLVGINAMGVARGRIFATVGARYFASNGVVV